MIRTAVIGLGNIAGVHIPILLSVPQVQLCAVCDIDPARREKAPDVPFYTDYLELLNKEKPDCVHLCLPHWLHYPVAKAAVERGIHVFTEKPLALNYREALEFAALEKAYPEVAIGLCLQNRYNQTVQVLRGLLPAAGKVRSVKGLVIWSRPKGYYEEASWRGKLSMAGGGVLINQAIHTLDLMMYLCGPVARVTGEVCNLLDYDIEVEDTAAARLEFANGAAGIFFATVAHGENTSVELEITLEKTKYRIEDEALYELRGSEKILLAENSRSSGEKFYYGTSHDTLIRLFYEDLQRGTCRYPGAKDGVSSLALIDAIRTPGGCSDLQTVFDIQ